MYLEHYKLDSDPFRLSPDAKFFYPSLSHVTAKNYMDYVLWSRDSFILITGEIGTGKTTLIQKMLRDAGPKLTVAKIHQTQLNEIEFLQALLDQFGINPFASQSKVELLSMLNGYLKRKYEEGETVVVIIDEAQNLSTRVLEEIRLLSGFDSDREKLLNIFLVGQPELKELLSAPEMEQLLQRIRLRFHLDGLGFDEIRSYIRFRLAIASREKLVPIDDTRKHLEFLQVRSELKTPVDLFSDELLHQIIKYTGGIPRLINTLCDTALLTAYARDSARVSSQDLDSAIEELDWAPYAERGTNRKYHNFKLGKYRLYVTKEGTLLSVENLAKDRVMIGRSHACDIKIDQKSVSGKHFQLTRSGSGYILEDLNSLNGTLVNGVTVDKKILADGDVIEVGKYQLAYKVNEYSGSEDVSSGSSRMLQKAQSRVS
ncbi:MAG: AAA family ATPase [Thiotrichales bacterium]